MVSHTNSARQAQRRAKRIAIKEAKATKQKFKRQRNFQRNLPLPENFPSPRFKFGDIVRTNDGDEGQIVGISCCRLGLNQYWWNYELDLFVESPNFSRYQGAEIAVCGSSPSVYDSPALYNWNEWEFTLVKKCSDRLNIINQLVEKVFSNSLNDQKNCYTDHDKVFYMASQLTVVFWS